MSQAVPSALRRRPGDARHPGGRHGTRIERPYEVPVLSEPQAKGRQKVIRVFALDSELGANPSWEAPVTGNESAEELKRDLSILLKSTADTPPDKRRRDVLEAVSATVSSAFGLSPDELAILLLSSDRVMVRFVYPPEMAVSSNTFPVTVLALANYVIKSGRSLLSNAVREIRHLAFYERVRIQGQSPRVIQKLLVVAFKGSDGQVKGVIEVSRRGESREAAGQDFRPEDQQVLEQLAALAAPVLEEVFAC